MGSRFLQSIIIAQTLWVVVHARESSARHDVKTSRVEKEIGDSHRRKWRVYRYMVFPYTIANQSTLFNSNSPIYHLY